jgi:lincosamide and streptogramin A transport system ATP-binding/permease protein
MKIEALLAEGDESSLLRYSELESEYRARGGYEINDRLAAELDALGVPEAIFRRPLATLSGGEQTRCLLAGLFAAENCYPLIDEPTNHLDLEGRLRLARYLADKTGFLLVSHDRVFLDAAIDHVVALNPETVDIQRSNYSTWRQSHLTRLAEQARSNALTRKEVARLKQSARDRRAGADARESDKTARGHKTLPSERGGDSGFIGARSARQMKRALAAERRADQAADARRATLADLEKHYPLKFLPPRVPPPLHEPLVRARDLRVGWTRLLFEPITFEVVAGERLALLGPNGCGKSSLLDLLVGMAGLTATGDWRMHGRIRVSRVSQIPRWRSGRLRDRLTESGLDESFFRQVMAALGVRGSLLDGPLERLSQGQQKKIELARSLCEPAHLYLWDEPLNYVDVDARERIEAAILSSGAAFIFVEHDAAFVERLATKRLLLEPCADPESIQRGETECE